MMMTQRAVSNFLQLLAFQQLYIAHASGRPQMVHDRVSFIEAFGGDNVLVSDALILVGRPLAVATEPDVMLARHFAELLVVWHCRILLLDCHSDPGVAGEESLEKSGMFRAAQHDKYYKLPRAACSRSMASNSALKLPLPKLFAPLRWMISKKSVGRSSTGLVNICSRYPSSSRSTKMPSRFNGSRSSSMWPTRAGNSS